MGAVSSPRTPPAWLMPLAASAALVGAVLLAAGLFLGYGTVSSSGVNCGSAFGGTSQNGQVQDLTNAMEGYGLTNVAGDCKSAVSSRHTTASALTWPGGVLLAGGVVAGFACLSTARSKRDHESASSVD